MIQGGHGYLSVLQLQQYLLVRLVFSLDLVGIDVAAAIHGTHPLFMTPCMKLLQLFVYLVPGTAQVQGVFQEEWAVGCGCFRRLR